MSLQPVPRKVFGTEGHFRKNNVHKTGKKIACFVRVTARALKNSVQKLALSTLSSLMKQDFQEDAVSRGREFLLLMLLYRKICKMCSSGQGSLAQNCSAGTRK